MTSTYIYGVKSTTPSIDGKFHYVYRITNLVENKHYYGKRSSKINPHLDLGKKYFSSSRDKTFINDQKENPGRYKYKIIQIIDNPKSAIEFETKLHKAMNVGKNPKFYNRTIQNSNGLYDTTGRACAKDKLGNILGSISLNDERWKTGEIVGVCKGRTDYFGEKNPFHGKQHSEETRRKISDATKTRTFTLKWYTNGSNNIYLKIGIDEIPENYYEGRTQKDSHRMNSGIGVAKLNRKWYTNGEKSIFVNSCDEIPEGFSLGRKMKSEEEKRLTLEKRKSKNRREAPYTPKGRKWYTNGFESIFINPAVSVPSGFRPGRGLRGHPEIPVDQS